MQYNRDAEGTLTPLQNQNIDTGLGLERMAQILQQVPNNYETDLILPIIDAAAAIAGIQYGPSDDKTKVSLKVIGDHVRAVVHMVADGITAANVGRGYVLRRLIRRVVRHGRLIGIEGAFISRVAETAIQLSETAFPNVRERETVIKAELDREEARFLETLERGEKLLAEILAKTTGQISGADAFVLYDTYGFPLELTQEIAEEQGLTVDEAGFEVAMAEQRQRSKDAHETIDLTAQAAWISWRSIFTPRPFWAMGMRSALARFPPSWSRGNLSLRQKRAPRCRSCSTRPPSMRSLGGKSAIAATWRGMISWCGWKMCRRKADSSSTMAG
jgi:alanyl-tRNA synthetase